ncbi:MAG: histidine phosphatase family protein [Rhodobacteraceae bacterium]|nr:histidine phosphatase family protein [Paracoccaceae bacterium]
MAVESAWYWIRHGPTNSRALNGWTDIAADLSDTATLDWLRSRIPEVAVVVASDLKRASATANAIAGNRIRLPDTKFLREFNFGEWEGKTPEQIALSHPEESHAFWNDPTQSSPPGGESWHALSERVSGFVDALIERHPGRIMVAVSHFGTIMTQAHRAANADNSGLLSRSVQNLSLTRLTHRNGTWTLHEFSSLP